MESDGLPLGASYQLFFILSDLFKEDISINVLWALIAVLVLLLFSALVSGSEIAFFSFDEPDIEELKDSENSKDVQILKVLENKKKLLATILISNNFINVGIIIFSNYIISKVFNFGNNDIVEILINVVLVTTFLVFFGEVMPKILASRKNFAFARFTLPIVKFFELIFFPLAFLLAKFGNFLDSKIEKKKNSIDLIEIEKAIDLGVDGNTKDKDKKILKGIVHFGNTTVKQIMKPRVDIFAISIEEEFHTVLGKIKESGFSRIPVFGEDIDDIKGVLYIKDLLTHLLEPNSFEWQQTLRIPDFTSEAKKIDDLLKEMQLSKQHMSIVADEYGGTEGLITLEDILEEVVGEINDEFDQSKKTISKNKDGSFSFDGKTPLIDVCKTTNVEIGTFEEAKGESDTLAGLVLEINENMPEEGRTIYFKNYEFNIIEISKNRIKKIDLKINKH
ncbi:MAG: putative hemolysin [Planctomycetota bacterium]